MGDVLAFVEQRDGRVRGTAAETISVAAELAESLGGVARACVVGGSGVGQAADGLGDWGAESVIALEHDGLSTYHPDGYSHALTECIRSGGYAAVVFAASGQGKDLAPRVAARLDVPLAADVTTVGVSDGTVTATRPVYSGKAFAEIRVQAEPALLTIRPNVFAAQARSASGTVDVRTPDVDSGVWKQRVRGFEAASAGTVDVAEASVVVSGGRGMKGPENWNLLEALRDALGADAALGASRAVVDAGWRPHGEQVGQTGKTVAPKLYFALGISGAIQHLAGMRTSQTIVAVNKDPDAPIFNVANYGIVGDVFEVLPRLTEEVAALRSES